MIVSVCNSKGGVGKSSIVHHLATTYANEPFNKSVLVIDTDPQRSLLRRYKDDFRYICISERVVWLESNIERLKAKYDVIVIDSGGVYEVGKPLSKQEVYKVLIFSDSVIIPIVAGAYSVESSLSFLSLCREVQDLKSKSKYPLKIIPALNQWEANRVDSKELLKAIPAIESKFGVEFLSEPLKRLSGFQDVANTESLYKGKPTTTLAINFKKFIDKLNDKIL